jgi:hypothetical protein
MAKSWRLSTTATRGRSGADLSAPTGYSPDRRQSGRELSRTAQHDNEKWERLRNQQAVAILGGCIMLLGPPSENFVIG